MFATPLPHEQEFATQAPLSRCLSESQLAQLLAPSEVQAVPVDAVPPLHEHEFWAQASPSGWNPVLQDWQNSRLSWKQVTPWNGEPLAQVHTFGPQVLSLSRWNPVPHVVQMWALFEVQPAPVAALPLSQVHVFSTQVLCCKVKPSLQEVHTLSPWLLQVLLRTPLAQLHTFTSQLLPLMWNPVLQVLQILALFVVQAFPVASLPLEQVHTLVTAHSLPENVKKVALAS